MGPAAIGSNGRLQVCRGAETGILRSPCRPWRIAQPLRALGWHGSETAQSARGVERQITSTRKNFARRRSEEHTSELQSQSNLVCRLLLEKKNIWRRAC